MTMVADVIVLVGVLRLLVELERPWLCAVIYASAVAILSLLSGANALSAAGSTALAFAYTAGWFRLLTRHDVGSAPWVLVLIAGLLLPAVMSALWRVAT